MAFLLFELAPNKNTVNYISQSSQLKADNPYPLSMLLRQQQQKDVTDQGQTHVQYQQPE